MKEGDKVLNVLSLFSGIGAFEKALDNLEVDFNLVNFCEFDKYAVKSYCAIHGVDESKNLGDITKVDETKLPKDIDICCYGFPCQDISLAGKQKGLFNEDGSQTRSGLFFEALRIIEATKPKIAIAENVKNLTSKKFAEQFKIVLDSLEEAGYNNYWKVLNAKDFGVPQNRERVFIVSIRKDIDTGKFEFPEAFPLEKRLKDVLEEAVDEKFYLSDKMVDYLHTITEKNKARGNGNIYVPTNVDGVSKTITTKEGSRVKDNFIEEPTMRQLGQIYPNSGNPQAGRIYGSGGISPTLRTPTGGDSMPKVAVGCAFRNCENGMQLEFRKDELSSALHGNIQKTMVAEPQVLRQVRTEYGKEIRKAYEAGEVDKRWGDMKQFEPRTDGIANTLSTVQKDNLLAEPQGKFLKNKNINLDVYREMATSSECELPCAVDEQNVNIRKDGTVGTLTTDGSSPKKNNRVLQQDLRIRKLTPKECFRLMGFDDESFHKAEAVNSNTQLYKQAGNSIVVDVLEELFCMMLDEDGNLFT